jgi:Fic-DOC domain mobile mystery protein B
MQPPAGATPLDPDEAQGLIPTHITTQEQLNEWELQNVLAGEQWAFGRKHKAFLSPDFMRQMHRRMFGDTWKWAGKIRNSEKNLGVAPETINVRLHDLCKDVEAQIVGGSWSMDEIAMRFHHRLVLIHPFPNGNGRFSRTMTDLLLVRSGDERFTWGAGSLADTGQLRASYIGALQAADRGDFFPLKSFLKRS